MFVRLKNYLRSKVQDILRKQEGATMVEYALMVALIAIVIVAAVAFLGKAASNKFSTIGSGVQNA